MKRIIIHWTAGAPGVIPMEADAYHYIVGWPHGTVTEGTDPPEANIPPLKSGEYAAHTLNFNSYSIGVAFDAMAGAKERPFSSGKYPITEAQVDAMVGICIRLMGEYGIPLSRETVLTHAEVEPTHGVKQRWKWDVTWLPGMGAPGDPIEVGDELRRRMKERVAPSRPSPPSPVPEAKPRGLAALFAAILRLFGRG